MERIEKVLAGITINTHSSVWIETAGKVLYVDPFRLEQTPHDADLIFATHDHFEHFSPEDVARAEKAETVFVLPASSANKLVDDTRGHRVMTVRPGDRGEAEGIPFEAVAAYNPDKPFHPKENAWVGYVLALEGVRVYVAGDTDATEEAAAVRCDIALLPIGGKYTMDPDQAAALAKRMRPQAVLPIHYGSVVGSAEAFDRFLAAAGGDVRVVKVVRQ